MRLLIPVRISYWSSETSSFAVFSIHSITSSDRDNPSGTLSPIQGASAVGSPATAVMRCKTLDGTTSPLLLINHCWVDESSNGHQSSTCIASF